MKLFNVLLVLFFTGLFSFANSANSMKSAKVIQKPTRKLSSESVKRIHIVVQVGEALSGFDIRPTSKYTVVTFHTQYGGTLTLNAKRSDWTSLLTLFSTPENSKIKQCANSIITTEIYGVNNQEPLFKDVSCYNGKSNVSKDKTNILQDLSVLATM